MRHAGLILDDKDPFQMMDYRREDNLQNACDESREHLIIDDEKQTTVVRRKSAPIFLRPAPLILLSLVLLACNVVQYTQVRRLKLAANDGGFSKSSISFLYYILAHKYYSRRTRTGKDMATVSNIYRI